MYFLTNEDRKWRKCEKQLFSKDMRGLESKDKNDGKALAKIFCSKQDGKS